MRQWIAIIGAASVVAATLPFIRQHDDKLLELLNKAKVVVTGGETPKKQKVVDPPALTDVDLTNIDDRRDVATAPAHGKRTAELTLDTQYQRGALAILRRGRVYEGAVVMTDVQTGKVLVWASHNQGRARDLAVDADAPAASVFKIVTGAALIEAGVSLNEKFCYRGGERKITRRELEPDEKRDKYCASLPMAMGRSINTVFARLALAKLNHDKLGSAARRLGWGIDLPFDVPVAQSTLELPEDDLEFARTAAGFWNSTLSPFQGANLALTIANNGMMIRSFLVDRVVDKDDEQLYRRPQDRQELQRVLNERTAWALARMMEQTVRNGSGYRAFHDRQGRPFLPDIRVGGKTGTLAKKNPETLYTWFVGFAPARKPQVAFGIMVANRGKWRVKAAHVACGLLRAYFADRGAPGVTYPHGYHGKKRRFVKKPKDANQTDDNPRSAEQTTRAKDKNNASSAPKAD